MFSRLNTNEKMEQNLKVLHQFKWVFDIRISPVPRVSFAINPLRVCSEILSYIYVYVTQPFCLNQTIASECWLKQSYSIVADVVSCLLLYLQCCPIG